MTNRTSRPDLVRKLSGMPINVDLLLEHMQAPYVPTLGAVHPLAFKTAIEDVFSVAQTNSFLPYDKDRRWYPEKKEHVLLDHVYQDEDQTIIPTFLKGANPHIKYHHYTAGKRNNGRLENLQTAISKKLPVCNTQVLSFSKDTGLKYNSLVFLAEMNDIKIIPQKEIQLLGELSHSIKATLPDLANNDPDNSGFAFIWERIGNGCNDGDILVSVGKNAINGAIGPLQISKDAIGRLTRLPPYFGVAKASRKSGVGAALWNAGLVWVKDRGAEYIILQAQSGSSAEHFYRKMGLKELGGVMRS
jgi:GNAT superfamily N-acetyltransferase